MESIFPRRLMLTAPLLQPQGGMRRPKVLSLARRRKLFDFKWFYARDELRRTGGAGKNRKNVNTSINLIFQAENSRNLKLTN